MPSPLPPIALALALALRPAYATQLADTPADPAAAARANPELCVQIISGPSALDSPSVRAAIEKELGLQTTNVVTPASVGTIRVEAGYGSSVTVSYASADGGTQLKRRIALPVDPARRVTVIAWIVGNLVRNEAGEVLLALANTSGNSASPDEQTAEMSAVVPAESSSVAPAAHAASAGAQQPVPPPESHVRNPGRQISHRHDTDLPPRVFHAALFSPLAVPTNALANRFHLSLSLAYGHVGALDGVGIGFLVDHLESRSNGFQVSGLWVDHEKYQGALIAGLALRGRGRVNGLQLAGAGAYVDQDLSGAQIAGAAVITRGRTAGLQLSGAFAYSGSDLRGAQTTGAVNVANGHVSGMQLSGGFNYGRGGVTGAQITGALNLAGDVNGLQLGVVNVARDVDGLQLGVVNVARQNRGLALGFFNWSETARLQPVVFFQNPGYFNAGYRTISGYSMGSISFGYDPSAERARTRFATGPRFAFDRFAFGAEFGYGWVLEHMKGKPSDHSHELELAGTASVEIVRSIVTIYGGGGMVLPVAGVVEIEPRGLIQAGMAFF